MKTDDPEQQPSDLLTPPRPGVIGLDQVLPGDMLLHQGTNKLMPTLIKAATGSPYTHASMYVGDGQGTEATWPDGYRVPPDA